QSETEKFNVEIGKSRWSKSNCTRQVTVRTSQKKRREKYVPPHLPKSDPFHGGNTSQIGPRVNSLIAEQCVPCEASSYRGPRTTRQKSIFLNHGDLKNF